MKQYKIGDILVSHERYVRVCKVINKYRNSGKLWYEIEAISYNGETWYHSNFHRYNSDCMTGYEVVKNKKEMIIALL